MYLWATLLKNNHELHFLKFMILSTQIYDFYLNWFYQNLYLNFYLKWFLSKVLSKSMILSILFTYLHHICMNAICQGRRRNIFLKTNKVTTICKKALHSHVLYIAGLHRNLFALTRSKKHIGHLNIPIQIFAKNCNFGSSSQYFWEM